MSNLSLTVSQLSLSCSSWLSAPQQSLYREPSNLLQEVGLIWVRQSTVALPQPQALPSAGCKTLHIPNGNFLKGELRPRCAMSWCWTSDAALRLAAGVQWSPDGACLLTASDDNR